MQRITFWTSLSRLLRPCSLAMHSYPSAWRGAITLLKHDPSAQRPWANTMLGLLGDIVSSLSDADTGLVDCRLRSNSAVAKVQGGDRSNLDIVQDSKIQLHGRLVRSGCRFSA